jgi:single-stranded DNA-specific DHH superfamily exonuclease
LAQGLLQRMGIDSSILEHYLEFVAIGTSADIVPLIDETVSLSRRVCKN